MKTSKIILALFIAQILCLFAPHTNFCQTEKLDIIEYTPPKGWTKTPKEGVMTFTDQNKTTDSFCILTVYESMPSSGDAQKDFANVWNVVIVKPFKADANPKTETQTEDGWTSVSGAAQIDADGVKSAVLMTVITGYGRTASVFAILNNQSYFPQIDAFMAGIKMDKTKALASKNPPPPPTSASTSPQNEPLTSINAGLLVMEFEGNEVRADQMYGGKRIRVNGTVNSIDVLQSGLVTLTFHSPAGGYAQTQCYFNKSQSSRLAEFSGGQQAVVEGTVKGIGGGMGGKGFVVLESCTVP